MNISQFNNLLIQSEEALNAVKAVGYEGYASQLLELETMIEEFRSGGSLLLSDSEILQIGIVGQMKAGKSSFLNSLLFDGEDILPKAATPMTAGLTIMEYAETNNLVVEYFSTEEWQLFKRQNADYEKIVAEVRSECKDAPEVRIRREIRERTNDIIASAHEMIEMATPDALNKIGGMDEKKTFKDISELKKGLHQYVGNGGQYTSVVKSLHLYLTDERIKGLRIVDTPGVNDPVISRENRTRQLLQSCHGVFMLSSASGFLTEQDVMFINSRIGQQGVSKVVLMASKFDMALQNIGADAFMNGKPAPSLSQAVNEAKDKLLNKRYSQILPTLIPSIQQNTSVDFTAGIGFAIAKKKESEWDEYEKKAVQQMKRFFPSEFDTEEKLKKNFLALANMETIFSQYLCDVFARQKDDIIRNKVVDYLRNNTKQIANFLSEETKRAKERIEELKDTSLAELETRQQQQQELFEILKDGFRNEINRFQTSLQLTLEEKIAKVKMATFKELPTEATLSSVICKGMLFGHNTEKVKHNQLDLWGLQMALTGMIEQYVDEVKNAWKEEFDNLQSQLSEKLLSMIFEHEKEAASDKFKHNQYVSIIESTLDSIRLCRVLSIDSSKYYPQIVSTCVQYSPSGTDELKKSMLDEHIRRQFDNYKIALMAKINALNEAIRADVDIETNKNILKAQTQTEQLKASFNKKISQNAEIYFEQLKKELIKGKEAEMQMENLATRLAELRDIFINNI